MKPSTRMTTTTAGPTGSVAATSYKQAVTKMIMMMSRGGAASTAGRHQVGLKLVPVLLLAICGLVCVVSASAGGHQLQKQTPPATSGRSQSPLTISGTSSQSNEPTTGAMAGNKGSSTSASKQQQQQQVSSPKDGDHQMALASDELASLATGSSAGLGGAGADGQRAGLANKVHLNQAQDMHTAAGHHYGKSHGGGHGKYYMYVESPKKGAYKMGYKRGNHKHMISAKASVHKSHVHAYYKWHDKKGKGSHKFEFKHYDKKGKKGHYY